MSVEDGAEEKVDVLSEVDKRFQQMQDAISQVTQNTNQNIQAIAEAIRPLQQQQRDAGTEVSEPEDFFDLKPGEFKKQILDEIKGIVSETVTSSSQANNAVNAKLAEITREYPEINDKNSDFYKAAMQAHNELDPSLQDTAAGYDLAALKAAQQVGLQPKSKRTSGDDNFNMGGSRSMSSKNKRKDREENVELDERTLAMSKLLGRDIEDPKVIEGLKKANQRKYKQYK